jgi:hypothetical protein
MACSGRRWFGSLLMAATLPTVFLACKREDPQIRALTKRASEADEAAQELRQAWSAQFQRLTLAGVKGVRFDRPMRLTDDQKRALEARVRIEKDSSRQGLLREILGHEADLQALNDRLAGLKAELPEPEIAAPSDSHYGLAMRFLKSRGQSDAEARIAISRVSLAERLAPGFEVYHFYAHGEYGTWVSQGRALISPRELAGQDPHLLANERDEAVAHGQRLQRELRLLADQKARIEGEIAMIQEERTRFLDGRAQLQSENEQQLARLNSLHYLVGVRDALETEGIIERPLFGRDQSGRNWRDAVFTHNLDLRAGAALFIRAQDLGLRQISKVSVVPGSYTPGEHYRLTLSADRQTATVELLTLQRFKNDKVVFAVVE